LEQEHYASQADDQRYRILFSSILNLVREDCSTHLEEANDDMGQDEHELEAHPQLDTNASYHHPQEGAHSHHH